MDNQELLELRKKLATSVNKLRAIVDLFDNRKFANVVNKEQIISQIEDINKAVAEIDEVDDLIKQEQGK